MLLKIGYFVCAYDILQTRALLWAMVFKKITIKSEKMNTLFYWQVSRLVKTLRSGTDITNELLIQLALSGPVGRSEFSEIYGFCY